ncbi:MAG: RNA methyltransferase [Nitrospirota bacterium]|nr:RNA methyltransferase [Nitrospirota bacterium]
MITSATNPKVKAVVKLRTARERARTGHILIDGARAVAMTEGRGMTLIEAFWCPQEASQEEHDLAQRLAEADIPVQPVAPGAFKKMAYGDGPDRLLVVAERPATALDALSPPDPALVLVVEGVEKPGNLGALLRTADAAGAHGVIVCDPACDPYGPNVVRASRGTVFSVPMAVAGAEEIVPWLHKNGIVLIAATPDGTVPYTKAALDQPCAIALGAEHAGVSEVLRAAAAQRVSLPMRGAADSLNVSVTGAVLLYEALRRRDERDSR